VSASSPTNNWV
jgi:hypothetical protein